MSRSHHSNISTGVDPTRLPAHFIEGVNESKKIKTEKKLSFEEKKTIERVEYKIDLSQ
jgi:hypothetical protein